MHAWPADSFPLLVRIDRVYEAVRRLVSKHHSGVRASHTVFCGPLGKPADLLCALLSGCGQCGQRGRSHDRRFVLSGTRRCAPAFSCSRLKIMMLAVFLWFAADPNRIEIRARGRNGAGRYERQIAAPARPSCAERNTTRSRANALLRRSFASLLRVLGTLWRGRAHGSARRPACAASTPARCRRCRR